MAKNNRHTKFNYAQNSNNQSRRRRQGPSHGMNMVSSKDKQSFKKMLQTFLKVFSYIGKYKNVLIFGLVLATLSSVLMMFGPNLIGQMTDVIQSGLQDTIDMDSVTRIAIILCVIYLLSAACSFIQQYTMAGATAKVCMKFRSDFITKLNKLPINYFNTHIQGDILSRITNDIQNVRQGISRCLPGFIKAIAQLGTCIIMMLITEWHLTLCVFAVIFITFGVVAFLMKISQKYFDLRQNNLGSLNGYIEEMYTGYQIIKMTRARNKVIKKFNTGNEALYKAEYISQFISGTMAPIMSMAGNFAIFAIAVVGSIMCMQGLITFGAIAAFLLYSNNCTQPLTRITQELTDLQSVCAAATRIFDFLEAEEIKPTKNAKLLNNPKGKVEFENVVFSYPSNKNKIIIKNFSAKIEPGQKIAIVGHTGAGKTTLINLLMRFYEIDGGDIKIDDVSIKEISKHNIHNIFGMVLQDTWLFKGTIRENLLYNLNNISDKKILEICKVCGIYNFVKSQPKGLDTVINSEMAISAGQKQLITIARAMLQNAPMLILDEATSSVDTKTEQEIQVAMDKLTKGRTSFVIAHRLSTIKNADCIFVIDDGDVCESGTHDQLLKLGKKYFELYNSQFEET